MTVSFGLSLQVPSCPACHLQPSYWLALSPLCVVWNCTHVFHMWFCGPLVCKISEQRRKCCCLWCSGRFHFPSQLYTVEQGLCTSWYPCIEFIFPLLDTGQYSSLTCCSNVFCQGILIDWNFQYPRNPREINYWEKGCAPLPAPSVVLHLLLLVWPTSKVVEIFETQWSWMGMMGCFGFSIWFGVCVWLRMWVPVGTEIMAIYFMWLLVPLLLLALGYFWVILWRWPLMLWAQWKCNLQLCHKAHPDGGASKCQSCIEPRLGVGL